MNKEEKIINNLSEKNDIEDDIEDGIEDDIDIEDDFFSDLFNSDTEVWFTDEKIETIKIHEYLENRKEIGKVNSIYSIINLANKINKNKLSNFELSVIYNEIPENYKVDLINPYINIEKNMVKISAESKIQKILREVY